MTGDHTDRRSVLAIAGLIVLAAGVLGGGFGLATGAHHVDDLRHQLSTQHGELGAARDHQAETDARVSQLSDFIASTGNTVPEPTTTTTVRHVTTTTARPRTAPHPTSTTTAPGTSTTAAPTTSQPTTTTTRPCSIGVPGDGCLVR